MIAPQMIAVVPPVETLNVYFYGFLWTVKVDRATKRVSFCLERFIQLATKSIMSALPAS